MYFQTSLKIAKHATSNVSKHRLQSKSIELQGEITCFLGLHLQLRIIILLDT